jgi:hypothetical protein
MMSTGCLPIVAGLGIWLEPSNCVLRNLSTSSQFVSRRCPALSQQTRVKLEGNSATKVLTSICMPVAIPMVVWTAWSRLPRRRASVSKCGNTTLMAGIFTNRLRAADSVGLTPAIYADGRLLPSAGPIPTGEQPTNLEHNACGVNAFEPQRRGATQLARRITP